MAAAIAVGHCWRAVAAAFDSRELLPEEHLVQVGVRVVDAEERLVSTAHEFIVWVPTCRTHPECSIGWPGQVGHLYVHIDLDVIDVVELKANSFSTPGGLAVNQVADGIRTAASRVFFSAASITALDPTLDSERAWSVGERLAHVVAGCPPVPPRTP